MSATTSCIPNERKNAPISVYAIYTFASTMLYICLLVTFVVQCDGLVVAINMSSDVYFCVVFLSFLS